MGIQHAILLISVLGTTGSGTSNVGTGVNASIPGYPNVCNQFINKLTGKKEKQCHSLVSHTTDVKAYACIRDGRRFIFMDTPAFNATRLSQREVLEKTAMWLKSM